MPKLVCTTPEPKVLPAVHPNVGILVNYVKKLDCLIDQMQASFIYWVRAKYKRKPPEMATDASPAVELYNLIKRLGRKWLDAFGEAAPKIAQWFTDNAGRQADATLKAHLKEAGFSVEFRPTRTWNDIRQATIKQNVSLIKSIPQQYLTDVEGLVMRSVQEGRNVGWLQGQLQQRYDVTKKRAHFIALDQNNKATAAILRSRQQEMGITKAIWLHSHGGKEPRKDHLGFSNGNYTPGMSGKGIKSGGGRSGSGPVYDITKGASLDEGVCWPGTLINCRCVQRSIIPGLKKYEKYNDYKDY